MEQVKEDLRRVPINFDTLVTCLWDKDVPCIYGEAWFVQVVIYFLVGMGLYTLRGAPKKKKVYGSYTGGYEDVKEDKD